MKFFIIILCTSFLLFSNFLPEDNKHLNYIHIFFSWPQIPNSQNYQFIIDTDSSFTNPDTISVNSNSLILEEGLRWDENYFWKICSHNEDQTTCLGTKQFTVNPIPSYHTDNIIIQYLDEENYYNGINILDFESLSYSLALDKYGEVIWFADKDSFDNSRILTTQILSNGNFMGFTTGTGYEFNIDSEIIFETPNEYNVHHQIMKSNYETYYLIDAEIEYHPCPEECDEEFSLFPVPWQGDRYIELDKFGELVWEWNTFDWISVEEYNPYYAETYNGIIELDWTHSNSILYDPVSESLIVSIRNLSRVTSIDYDSKEINWNLGDSNFMLNPDFENEINFSQQHSVQLTPNGNLIFFDNARYQNPELSRCIEVDFDSNNEPYLVWEHVLPDTMFTGSRGECDRLVNGNSLISAGRTGNVLEVDSDNQIIWHLKVYDNNGVDVSIYRTERVQNLYPDVFSFEIDQLDGEFGSYYIYNNGYINTTVYNHGWLSNEFQYELLDEDDNSIVNGFISADLSVVYMLVDISNLIFEDNTQYKFRLSSSNNIESFQEIIFNIVNPFIGDINNDQEINVLDIIDMLNIILDDLGYIENADLNNDQNIDILDIIYLINIILF